jgi:predicted phosphodiesterase
MELSMKTREWGEGLMASEEVGFLRRLPIESYVSIDGLKFHLMHGSHEDKFYRSLTSGIEEHEIEREFGEVNTDFILLGHSHKPFIRHLGKITILNPGSVGQPRDFNPRASYAVIEDGKANIKRVKYDIEKTVRELEKSSLPKDVIRELVSILVIGGLVKDEVYYC